MIDGSHDSRDLHKHLRGLVRAHRRAMLRELVVDIVVFTVSLFAALAIITGAVVLLFAVFR